MVFCLEQNIKKPLVHCTAAYYLNFIDYIIGFPFPGASASSSGSASTTSSASTGRVPSGSVCGTTGLSSSITGLASGCFTGLVAEPLASFLGALEVAFLGAAFLGAALRGAAFLAVFFAAFLAVFFAAFFFTALRGAERFAALRAVLRAAFFAAFF